jgi:GNAT superfamily N-acetyltransferase
VSTRIVDDPDELAALFLPEKHLHIYALADLAEPFWSASTWWRNGDAAFGLVSLSGNHKIVYAVSSADPDGTLSLAAELATDLPATIVTGVTGIGQVFEEAGRELVWHRGYHRFHLTDPRMVLPRPKNVVDLGPGDADELLALYATQPDAAYFLREMLDANTFVGVRRNGELVAAAGTHVLDERYDVAAIGAVYTHPDHRGAGLGLLVTAGVIDRIHDRIGTIGLNCTETNVAARTIYARLGFSQLLAYEECEIYG